MLMDRVDYVLDHSASGTDGSSRHSDLRPSEVLARNFWFCTIDDPSVIPLLDRIGPDHVMVESDYPHADSTRPDTQAVLASTFGHLGEAAARQVASESTARLFYHPLAPERDWRA
jgi:hypothetical protein